MTGGCCYLFGLEESLREWLQDHCKFSPKELLVSTGLKGHQKLWNR